MTIDLAPEAEAALDRIASMSSFSRDELVTRAIESYANWLADETAKVERGRADFAAGRYKDHDEFFDELERELGE